MALLLTMTNGTSLATNLQDILKITLASAAEIWTARCQQPRATRHRICSSEWQQSAGGIW